MEASETHTHDTLHLHEAPPPRPHGRACSECQASLDEQQRYCVRCGARQRDVYDPAARYFSASTRRRRTVAAPVARAGRAEPGSAAARWAALFLVLLPVAVAIGVLVGKGNGNDDKLIDALKSQRGTAVAAGPSAQTATAAATSSGSLPSDFPYRKGFAVKVATLPAKGTDVAAVKAAEAAAKAKGAPKPGLISPKDFAVKPDPGGGSYVVYSGSFKTRPEAAKLLAKLKKKVSGAEVIEVTSRSGAAAAGKPLSKTSFGTAHKLEGYKPDAARVKQDTQLVQQINHQTGRSYVQQQQHLPDTISVGGSPGSSTPPPATGPGQP